MLSGDSVYFYFNLIFPLFTNNPQSRYNLLCEAFPRLVRGGGF